MRYIVLSKKRPKEGPDSLEHACCVQRSERKLGWTAHTMLTHKTENYNLQPRQSHDSKNYKGVWKSFPWPRQKDGKLDTAVVETFAQRKDNKSGPPVSHREYAPTPDVPRHRSTNTSQETIPVSTAAVAQNVATV